MVDTEEERAQRAEQQRARRLGKRNCGYCDEPADAMLAWRKRQVAICTPCQVKLETPTAPAPFCAFEEVHPKELRSQTMLEAVLVEARLLPAPELVVEDAKPSLVSRILDVARRLLRRGDRRGTVAAISGETD